LIALIRNVSPLISPELLKILAEMGHGDTIVLADANFPAMSRSAKNIVRADGLGVPALLSGILDIFPIDTFVKTPVTFMKVVPEDGYKPVIWPVYKQLLGKHGINDENIAYLERMAYYEETDKSYCIVITGERARYGNIILKKGILEAEDIFDRRQENV